ncbi:MAG: GNAT family N-acetyltransferase [Bdellovibrio sp.]
MTTILSLVLISFTSLAKASSDVSRPSEFQIVQDDASSTINYSVNGTKAGYVEFSTDQRGDVVIDMIYVKPEFQGKGISIELIKHLINSAGENRAFKAQLIGTNEDVFVAKYNQMSHENSTKDRPLLDQK